MALLTVNIPTKNYQVGTASINPSPVLPGSSSMLLTIDVTQWTDPDTRLDVVIECHHGDGLWGFCGGLIDAHPDANGKFIGKGGAVLSEIKASVSWTPTITDLRGTITIIGGTVRVGGSVVVE